MKTTFFKSLIFAIVLVSISACDNMDEPNNEPVDLTGLYDFYLYEVATNKNTIINVNPNTIEGSYSISPDSKKILYVNHDGINLMNIDGTNNKVLMAGGESPCFSPKGYKIAYTKSGKLYTCNIDGTNNTQLSIANIIFSKPLWSNDSLYVACNSSIGLAIVSMTGDVKVISQTNSSTWYDWSLDSKELYYSKYDDKTYLQVYKYNLDYTNESKLTDGAQYSYSPDGNPIVNDIAYITSANNGGSNLCLMKPDGSEKNTILTKKTIGSPFWSPTGNELTFITEGKDIAIVDKTGLNYKVINEEPGACLDPNWSNDGKYILYYRAIYY